MIRLGSLAGYPFEGPRLLAGWTAPARAAVYAVMYQPDRVAEPQEYGVVYVAHSDDLSAWLGRVDNDRFRLYICTYEAPGAKRPHREQIVRELVAVYRPGCNADQYDQAWKDEWIGEYQAPTTGPLTTDRDPSPGRG